ncbi:DUF3710 domain-containing protein [Paeniglutamicibacter sp. ABSL32-1]|uniref:DUF3710 domain-containing protein n=1 Tax=Paeniglutamicibacter quisquiliarum TaxID=2849498 RepID=UPI001C2D9CEF|nr:DUF3710 domain-containing protein [Paeniglutamicibacter quisquiliarum]MBV1780317.1 DUF3710 domain-containing protein [Paeniglutamicibacter quisquiliarum]
MIFKRKKKAGAEAQPEQTIAGLNAAASSKPGQAAGDITADAPEAAPRGGPAAAADSARTAPVRTGGPFDGDDFEDHDGYLDLGALLIKPVPGLQLRLEVEESTQRVIAVALEIGGSRMQLQVFAAPKTDELWPGISTQIATGIADQGGETEMVPGRFGNELLARVPQAAPDGRQGHVALRFLGIDGPRWFLRAVIGGAALTDTAESKTMEDALAQVVVVRGDTPMPPTELLPLTVPSGALARPDADQQPGTERPERGPEITQIG